MKNEIIDFIKLKPRKFSDLKKEMNIKGYQESKNLDKCLRELVTEQKIFYKKSSESYGLKTKREIMGTFFETKNGYGFVDTDEGKSFFIPERFTLNALQGDSVRVMILPPRDKNENKGEAGKIVRVLQRNGNNIIGIVKKEEDKFLLDVLDKPSKHPYRIINTEDLKEGDLIVSKFVDFVDFEILVKSIDNIGVLSADKDWTMVSKQNGLDINFENEILEEAKKLKNLKIGPRKDLTNRLIVTIDGADSKDLDDAVDISVLPNGNWRLGVHIADVGHYVKEDSIIDEEAYKRGTSVYLINKVIPMLPETLSNDLCSLNPNTKKLAMTVDMEVDKYGKVVKRDFYESIIESKHRLTYNQVDELLNGDIETLINKDLTIMISEAKKIADISRDRKIKLGMIDFQLPELKVKLNEKDEPTELSYKYQTLSEKVIEDLMVLTNETVAASLNKKNIPSLFRIHPKPKEDNLDKFKQVTNFFGFKFEKEISKITNKDLMNLVTTLPNDHSAAIIKRMLIQTMEKAIYSEVDYGHFGQGLENYLHFTSPIRRYPDLVVHRTVKKYLIEKTDNNFDSDERIQYLQATAKLTSERERIAMTAERRLMDIKKTRIMKKQVGTVQDGMIVAITNFGLFVELENFTQGLIKFEKLIGLEAKNDKSQQAILTDKDGKVKKYKLGQTVSIKIVDLDIPRGLMDFSFNESS